jgi:rhamnose utilization protein RhaD (predicted bifunctional aldolase and dehydrogenase)/NAD(P)-dependent dehydrogenase (short-subunit alcohol dehydrogenase family)
LLHAFLPHRFIDHSHADAILALVDQPEAERLCKEVFGDSLAIVPYIMPGFDLAKLAAEVHEANPDAEGLLLLQHGLFTYGDTAREAYERHVEAVSKAETYLATARAQQSLQPRRTAPVAYEALAPIIRGALGGQFVFDLRDGDGVRAFVEDERLESWSQRGPVTPDHVIRTKQKPLILDLSDTDPGRWGELVRDKLEAYRQAYRGYVNDQLEAKGVEKVPLDPDPRVFLVPGLGLIGAGANPKAARVAADLYEHTIGIIQNAEAVGSYQALPDADIFDMEYWSLEQAKLGKKKPRELEGMVVIVTGAASGIGKATAKLFTSKGACLFLVDRDREGLMALAAELGCPFADLDVTDAEALRDAVTRCVKHYGGLDGVVSNAGIAPQSPMADCAPELLAQSLDVNLIAHQTLAAAAVQVMRAQDRGGFLLFNASKAAFNPGAEFGPYAIAKAALVALMKQYALEAGKYGIRSNAINADRIQTGLLPMDVVEARAKARGLEADDYFRSNLLKTIVTAEDVAQGFLQLALAKSTSGGVLTIDGGNIAASPR